MSETFKCNSRAHDDVVNRLESLEKAQAADSVAIKTVLEQTTAISKALLGSMEAQNVGLMEDHRNMKKDVQSIKEDLATLKMANEENNQLKTGFKYMSKMAIFLVLIGWEILKNFFGAIWEYFSKGGHHGVQ